MSLKATFGAESRSSASFSWKRSLTSGGIPAMSMNDATWPIFMAAPFIWPSTSTICSAASIWRRSAAARRPSLSRVRLAALVAYESAAWPPTSPPTFAVRRIRLVGIGLSRSFAMHQLYGRCGAGGPLLDQLGRLGERLDHGTELVPDDPSAAGLGARPRTVAVAEGHHEADDVALRDDRRDQHRAVARAGEQRELAEVGAGIRVLHLEDLMAREDLAQRRVVRERERRPRGHPRVVGDRLERPGVGSAAQE